MVYANAKSLENTVLNIHSQRKRAMATPGKGLGLSHTKCHLAPTVKRTGQ